MVELPPSEDEITVEEGVGEINRIGGMALGTGGALAGWVGGDGLLMRRRMAW